MSEPEPATWTELRAAVATTQAFVAASPQDTYVRRAWLGGEAFYLRWHYYDEGDSPFASDPAAGGDLDVTADGAFIARASRELALVSAKVQTQDADAFFQQRWNGSR